MRRRRHNLALSLALVTLGCALVGAPRMAGAGEFLPDSPEVKQLIAKGMAFLEKSTERRPGGEALAGLAMLKAGAPPTHPRVQQSLATVREQLARAAPFENLQEMYTPCVEILFLVALDPQQNRNEINIALNYLLSKQKKHGGWGYVSKQTGDTSMTQYAVLAMWELNQAGISTPLDAWERVANWLLRTQDPSGAFGYQGTDPGEYTRVSQKEVRHSMAVAGLGSVYICGYYLGLEGVSDSFAQHSAALTRVEKKRRVGRSRLTNKVDPSKINEAEYDGNRWMHAKYSIKPSLSFSHYYLYTLERYESFRELTRGLEEEEYQWYDDGVRLLTKTQMPDGSWASAGGAVVDTSFSLLFLIRSTQKSLGQAGLLAAGTLIGGRGLPKDLSAAQLKQGVVVPKPMSGPAEQLLRVIDNPADPAYMAAVEGFRELTLEADEATLDRQAVKLRKLAGGSEPAARLAAVQALSRTRDMANVPTLIYALSDPDPRIVAVALNGLRFVSRKFRGLGEGEIKDEASRRAAIEAWQAWYRSVRPEANFERD